MNKNGWKYSKKKLAKHEFCAAIINPKKVICICGKTIKLGRKWDEDFLNRHVNGNGCKRKIGQRSIYCFFNNTISNENEEISSEEEYDSDICDSMNNDNIITVDSEEDDIYNNSNDILSSEDEDQPISKQSKKRICCPGLRSQRIRYYIERTPAQVGGARRIEVIGKELFPLLFVDKFSQKKLNISQKRKLNRQIYTEAEWKIDREGFCVRGKNCNGEYINNYLCIECKNLKSNAKLVNRVRVTKPDEKNLKFTPNWYFENDKLKKYLKNGDLLTIWNIIKNNNNSTNSNLWITIATKGLKGAFNNLDTFKGLCNIMCQVIDRKEKGKGTQNLQYSEEFTSFLVILGTISPRALDLFRQNLVGRSIQSIRQLLIIALIPNNGRDSADIIANLHKKLLLEIASQLNISIISIGSDGAAAEFKAQSIIMNMQTINKIEIIDSTLNINFSCPILSNIGPVIRIQDPKHAKKTARNIIMSGARVLTFGKHIANFEHFLNLVNSPTSVLYKNDVIKLDRQDDGAAYRSFCYHNLAQCLNKNEIKKGYEGELVDSYLNREICPVERIRMCMTAYFFLRLWRYHIETVTRNYPNFMFIQQNFMAIQSFSIFNSLSESMVLLVKSYREYYPEFPLLPWMHGSEACEHVFGIARQIRTDFDFAELLQMISKISHYSKSIRTSNLLDEKEKSVREGII
ncbi:hypothetical protein Glove_122g60 [Diversispora epigaea]|uniref:Uncharacterized protein n=1 Tax=Diversispora epigaea TaxID=1348612 RepID=A0A397J2U4_9GLOM|nr:hypothetical protein Glove_122g60 [Diversispora epigaea]